MKLVIITLWLKSTSFAQGLQAGFNKSEYLDWMKAYSRWSDSVFYRGIGESTRFKPVYRS